MKNFVIGCIGAFAESIVIGIALGVFMVCFIILFTEVPIPAIGLFISYIYIFFRLIYEE